MRIGVLSFNEVAGRDRATQLISKSTAIKWLTLGTHRYIDKRTIQQIDPRKVGKICHQRIEPPARSYLTEHFGSGEIPGIKTTGPLLHPDFVPAAFAGITFRVRSIHRSYA